MCGCTVVAITWIIVGWVAWEAASIGTDSNTFEYLVFRDSTREFKSRLITYIVLLVLWPIVVYVDLMEEIIYER